jgi:hypothetical protein
MRANTLISWLTAILVTFLAASAFVLSYDVLRQIAQENGVNPALACLWPLTLDAVMIAASLAVLRGTPGRLCWRGAFTHYHFGVLVSLW